MFVLSSPLYTVCAHLFPVPSVLYSYLKFTLSARSTAWYYRMSRIPWNDESEKCCCNVCSCPPHTILVDTSTVLTMGSGTTMRYSTPVLVVLLSNNIHRDSTFCSMSIDEIYTRSSTRFLVCVLSLFSSALLDPFSLSCGCDGCRG